MFYIYMRHLYTIVNTLASLNICLFLVRCFNVVVKILLMCSYEVPHSLKFTLRKLFSFQEYFSLNFI